MNRYLRPLAALVFAAFAFNASAAVEVNQASQAELETVKGIGPGLSGKILEARKAGAFKSWSDIIDRVPGIGAGNAARRSCKRAAAASISAPNRSKPRSAGLPSRRRWRTPRKRRVNIARSRTEQPDRRASREINKSSTRKSRILFGKTPARRERKLGIFALTLCKCTQNLLAESNAFTYFPPRVEVADLGGPSRPPATELIFEDGVVLGGPAEKIFCRGCIDAYWYCEVVRRSEGFRFHRPRGWQQRCIRPLFGD